MIKSLARAAEETSSTLYLVGGYIRDAILGRERRGQDLDLVVCGDALSLAKSLAKRWGGTLVPLDAGTFRVVMEIEEGHYEIDISSLRGSGIEEDLKVRDFTIDSIAIRLYPPEPYLIDPLGGLQDIERRVVRASSPTVFQEDPLRLLRAIRLSGELGFSIDEGTYKAIREGAPMLSRVAPERVRDELFRILALEPSAPYIRILDEVHLLVAAMPQAAEMKGLRQSSPHQLPLWEHSLRTMERLEALLDGLENWLPNYAESIKAGLAKRLEGEIQRRSFLKLVALLHDIGKPRTFKEEPDGKIRFLDHEEVGSGLIGNVLASLRLGRKATSLGVGLVKAHLRPLQLRLAPRVSDRARFRFFRDLGEMAGEVLLLSMADIEATTGEEGTDAERHRGFTKDMLDYYYCHFRRAEAMPLIKGDEVIEAFGLKSGPFIGFLLERVQEEAASGRIRGKGEALEYLRRRMEEWKRTFESPQ